MSYNHYQNVVFFQLFTAWLGHVYSQCLEWSHHSEEANFSTPKINTDLRGTCSSRTEKWWNGGGKKDSKSWNIFFFSFQTPEEEKYISTPLILQHIFSHGYWVKFPSWALFPCLGETWSFFYTLKWAVSLLWKHTETFNQDLASDPLWPSLLWHVSSLPPSCPFVPLFYPPSPKLQPSPGESWLLQRKEHDKHCSPTYYILSGCLFSESECCCIRRWILCIVPCWFAKQPWRELCEIKEVLPIDLFALLLWTHVVCQQSTAGNFIGLENCEPNESWPVVTDARAE